MNQNAVNIAANLIKGFEGYSSVTYNDAGKPAIGYGHRIIGNEVTSSHITPAQAEELLKKDMSGVHNAIVNNIKANISDNQYAALMSFGYNAGVKPLMKVISEINSGNVNGAAQTLGKYVYSRDNSGGMSLNKVLVDRRKRELSLFFDGRVNDDVINNAYNKLETIKQEEQQQTTPIPSEPRENLSPAHAAVKRFMEANLYSFYEPVSIKDVFGV